MDVVLYWLTIFHLLAFLHLRSQPGNHQVARDLGWHESDLLFELGLADHSAIAKLLDKVLSKVLAVIRK
jgi:hypothetical protein